MIGQHYVVTRESTDLPLQYIEWFDLGVSVSHTSSILRLIGDLIFRSR